MTTGVRSMLALREACWNKNAPELYPIFSGAEVGASASGCPCYDAPGWRTIRRNTEKHCEKLRKRPRIKYAIVLLRLRTIDVRPCTSRSWHYRLLGSLLPMTHVRN